MIILLLYHIRQVNELDTEYGGLDQLMLLVPLRSLMGFCGDKCLISALFTALIQVILV